MWAGEHRAPPYTDSIYGLNCARGIFFKEGDRKFWVGFQNFADYRSDPPQNPAWNKWVLCNARGVLYCQATPGRADVWPAEGAWQLCPWAVRNTSARPGVAWQ